MAHMGGVVEFFVGDSWYEVIDVGSLILRHCDLFGCLFGVDNYGGFIPLFADRGMPHDGSMSLAERMKDRCMSDVVPSWVLWKELDGVDWSEVAPVRDLRTTECSVADDGTETFITKWVNKRGFEWVREALDRAPEVELRSGNLLFRRVLLRRSDALTDTDFPLVMRLMECLAERFGDEGVRLVVWFE